MKLNKKIAVAISALLLLPVFASCGGGGDISVQLPTEAAKLSIADLRSEYNANKKLKIDFWTGFGSAMSTAVEEGIAEFEKKYDFISVNHESKGGYDGLYSAMVKSLNSRSYPNLAVGYPDHFAGYLSSNIQYALDPLIESKEYGVDLDDFYEQYLHENQALLFKDEEKTEPWTVGLPFNKSTEAMVYNKDFFEAFGITPPQTWDEVEEVGTEIINTLTNGNYFGKKTTINYTVEGASKSWDLDLTSVAKDDFYPFSYDSQANFFITLTYQFGGEYTEMGDTLEDGYIKFNNQKVLEALDMVKDLYAKHIIGIPSVWNEPQYCSNPFKAIKSVMTVSSTAGVANNIPSGAKFNIGIAPIPYKDASRKCVISQGTNLAIFTNKSPEKVLASWLLVRYLTGGEYKVGGDDEFNANVDFAISTGYLPVTKSGEESAWYKQYLASESITPSATDKAKIGVQKIANQYYVQQNWNKFVDPAFVGSADVRQVVGKIIPFILTGAGGKIYTPQEAINYAYSQLVGYIKK